ncbi:FkbM family methyltransferase [Polynucleobacter paneuropaeus]|nr:FkbM family methyltransferase [Polynucleobacter paneuropaeus]
MMKYIKLIYLNFKKIISDIESLLYTDSFRHNLIIDSGKASINLNFPEDIKRVRIDIGLSHNAPNSAKWIKDNQDLMVIGIEANQHNIRKILRCGIWSKNDKNRIIKPYKTKRLQLIYGAIDNVPQPGFSDFYNIRGDSGTSSLLKPTNALLKGYGYTVRSITKTPTFPLKILLQQFPWERFPYIEVCKIDTQGKDLDVLLSMGEYIKKIAMILVEVDTFGQYEGAPTRAQIYDFMQRNGFGEHEVISNINNAVVDVIFFNENYMSLKNEIDKNI